MTDDAVIQYDHTTARFGCVLLVDIIRKTVADMQYCQSTISDAATTHAIPIPINTAQHASDLRVCLGSTRCIVLFGILAGKRAPRNHIETLRLDY